MNMFEGLGAESPEGTNTTVPVGTHLAKVDGYKFNHEKGNVGLAFYFTQFRTKEWGNYYIKKKDGTTNHKQLDLLILMFKNVGITVNRGPSFGQELEQAFKDLKDNHYMVNIKVNGDFRNYFLEGTAVPPSQSVETTREGAPEGEDAPDDDLPF